MRGFDLWSVPFDGGATLGWPGSRYAPDRVRKALGRMRMRTQAGRVYALDGAALLPVPDDLLTERGDVGVVPHDLVATHEACAAAVAQTMRAGRVPIVVGGDDSLLFACVRGFHDAVSGSVAIIHFDAHLDLLDENPAQGRFSHSSGMRRALELERVDAKRSIQVGVRHFNFPSSAEFIGAVGLAGISAVEFARIGTEAAVRRILERVEGAEHVFWSFDIDAIDPAFAPGAGAHEPGGLTSRQALDCVRLLAPHVGGFAVLEVNPLRDVGDMTSTLAAYLVYSFAVYGAGR